MKWTRFFPLVLAAILCMSAAAGAQVVAQLPAKALVVVHVKNMQDVSQKIAALAQQMGFTDQDIPGVSDPLAAFLKKAKLQTGIKKDGDFAVALLNNLQAFNGPTPPMLMLVDTTDYQAFLTNFHDSTTDGPVTTATAPGGPTVYVAKWGEYAAMAFSKDVIAAPAGGLVLSPAATKEFDKDACVVLNMPTVRAMVLPLIIVGRQAAVTQLDRGLRPTPLAKYVPLMKIGFNEAADFVQHLLTDCDDVTLAANIAPAGISFAMVSDFKPDSHIGQLITDTKNTDQPLLAGLPDNKYLFLLGGISDPKKDSEVIGNWLDPLLPEVQNLGDSGKLISDYIQAIKDFAAAQTGASFGLVAPEGELGASPLFQFVGVRKGNAKQLAAATTEGVQAQQEQMKLMAAGNPLPMQFSVTPAAKTISGVQLDQMHIGFDMAAAQNPQIAQIGQIMTFVYGQDGMNIYTGIVNDTTFIGVGGIPDEKLAAAVDAAKNGTDVLDAQPGIQNTAAQLPKQRCGAMFLPLDTLVNTAFGYVAKFGLDMGVTMPPSDPIGVTLSTDGPAVRADAFVPTPTLIGVAQVTKKLVGRSHPPAAAAPAGGAL